jgi:endonuclease/exonuclease/phosphatase family metal-dependent hydrolase
MRLASYNLETLFDRARAMALATWAEGKVILDAFGRLNQLLNKPAYTAGDKQQILKLLKDLGISASDDGGKFALLRQNRGKLLRRSGGKPVEVVAGGRGDWIGWVELKTGVVNEIATRNTARVIRDLEADVIGCIEVDDRIALERFNTQLLPAVGAPRFAHSMVIDGNDDRGIDVGLMTRAGIEIAGIQSHVDDADAGGRIFSRDCPEYALRLPSGEELLLLINHLKSKGFGSQSSSNAKRKKQARRVRAIYEERRAAGASRVAVIGDFNDTPGSDPLAPLLAEGSDLRDVSTHPAFQDDGRPGTFGEGTKSQKLDYILLSPALYQKVETAGVFRKGVWGGKNGDLWEHYPEMTRPAEAASDHAAIWVELAL